MEDTCEFVSSRGIMKSCDIYPRRPCSDTYQLLGHDWSKLRDGCTVYISSASLTNFVNNIFWAQPFRINLVTGDSDKSVPTQVLSAELIERLLADEKLISWWSQNLIVPNRHPKLRPMPIGLDYHTIANAGPAGTSWGPFATPIDQEVLLKRIRDEAKPLAERKCMIHSNFHFAIEGRQFGFDRRDAMSKLPADLVHYEPTPTDREMTWRRQSEFVFVASPMGGGLDCHRTWEALVLGCIPVMRKLPIARLFEDLPVLMVDDWSDVTKDLLEKTQAEFAGRTDWNWKKLTLAWWMDNIKMSS